MFVVIVALVLFFLICIFLRTWWRKRKLINQIPGPPGLPILGVLIQFICSSEEIWNYIRKYSIEYYPIYQFWQLHQPAVNLVSPEDIEILLSSPKYASKGDIYRILESWLNKGLLTSNGEKWQSRRKILTPTFHFSILQDFFGVFVEGGELLAKKLEEECDKPYTDVIPIIANSTLHIICETALGTKLEGTKKFLKEYTEGIHRMGYYFVQRLICPWYQYPLFYFCFPNYWREMKIVNKLHDFSKSVIAKRKSTFHPSQLEIVPGQEYHKKRRLGMLDLLFSASLTENLIDDEGIREEVDTFMFEGHDTTTACISFTLFLLACNREVQETVVEELREVLGDGQKFSPTMQDIQNLHYLDMVVKESLRMYPSVPFLSRKPDSDLKTHSGYTIPANTNIFVHIYDLHRNPQLYPDPDRFDPDRFLPENTKGRHPFAYLPFSAGSRNCIGQRFAMLEVKTVLAAILRKFVLEPVDNPSTVTMVVDVVMRSKNGLKIKFRLR